MWRSVAREMCKNWIPGNYSVTIFQWYFAFYVSLRFCYCNLYKHCVRSIYVTVHRSVGCGGGDVLIKIKTSLSKSRFF